MNTLDIRAELSVRMLDVGRAIDMGMPYPELKKIYTEIKELQLQAAFADVGQSTSKSSDLIIE